MADDSHLLDDRTVLYPYGCNNSSCGYCNVKIGNKSYMMLAGVDDTNTYLGITPTDYKDLLDRGWRRSGNILYKPDMKYSCCQEYTIRLEATKFKPGAKQRRSINAWTNYIQGLDYRREQAQKYPISREEKKRKRREGFDLIEKVHEPEYDTMKLKNPIEPAHKLEVRLEENTFTQEKYKLFYHYQIAIHKDEKVSESGFKRFLCTNPFKPRYSVDEKGRKIGAYHQCYYLDGRLIALAVLDLLPDCVSGVYFMYHTDFMQWNFGKLSALREIALAIDGGYKHYYMGYYIHTCPKMRYKCEYGPGLVLDPESYEWHPFDDDFRSWLDKRPYVSLTQERKIANGEIPKPSDEEEAETAAAANAEHNYHPGAGDPIPTVFTTRMSGVLKTQDVEDWLGDVLIVFGTRIASSEMLGTWETQDIDDPASLKHKLAEVAATVGQDVAMRIMVCLAISYT
ncbi:Arginyl-tRNA--protein transferase 1 [Orbilia brochopaga]|uniref:Arginyl-tRNA--protein transferase 1 n=1 Tax=Orbilia brochopaga TaxID=3140254 RepID=A0AAV9VBX4_9PEZI